MNSGSRGSLGYDGNVRRRLVIGRLQIVRTIGGMTDKSDAEDNHPERQKVIIHCGNGVNDTAHVAKHPNHPSNRRGNTEISDPARETRAVRQHCETGKKEEQAEAQLSKKLTDVIPEEAI